MRSRKRGKNFGSVNFTSWRGGTDKGSFWDVKRLTHSGRRQRGREIRGKGKGGIDGEQQRCSEGKVKDCRGRLEGMTIGAGEGGREDRREQERISS